MSEIEGRSRDALVAELVKRMRAQGSWGGETHIQKATFLLDEMLDVDLGLKHVLYMYGPFSFPLREELEEMRSRGLLKFELKTGYGPRLVVTDAAEEHLIGQFPKTIEAHSDELDFVATHLKDSGVAVLEELTTALWVIREDPGRSVDANAERLNEIKPHVSIDRALEALAEISAWNDEWSAAA